MAYAYADKRKVDLGNRVDMPDALREKMESSFNADLSNVQLYESQAVAIQ